MKRIFSLLIALIMLLSGCSQTEPHQTPVTFYYLSAELSYAPGSGAVASEIRDASAMGTTEDIFRAYLNGPKSDSLLSPFPAGLALVSFICDDDTVYITVTEQLSILSNLDLSLACSCIALTALDLTGLNTVCLEANGSLLGGQKTITINRNSISLSDGSAAEE